MTFATRILGHNGPTVSAIELGCMGMSEFYGHSYRQASLAEGLRGKREKAFI